jgi:hypothetical protein
MFPPSAIRKTDNLAAKPRADCDGVTVSCRRRKQCRLRLFRRLQKGNPHLDDPENDVISAVKTGPTGIPANVGSAVALVRVYRGGSQ